jgi:hypothetical protein
MRSLTVGLLMLSAPLAAQPAVQWARVTYISGTTIYVDAGSRAGLRERDHLDVVRGGQVVGTLVVDFISSTRAACSVVTSLEAPAIGDSVRFTAVPAAVDSTPGVTTAPRGARRRADALRGRLGLRYLVVDPGENRAGWTQPALDLRLDGQPFAAAPISITADVRAYRQRRGATGRGTAASTRVYQANVAWGQSNQWMHATAGRQLTPALSTMGIFDGVTVEAAGKHVSGGAVAGAQPDAASFGISGIVREYGAWIQAHHAPGSTGTWSLTVAGIGSYDRGNIDREYAYAQATLTSRYVSLFATQEVDVNRGWKRDVEGGATTPTSTFAMLRVAPLDAVSFTAGYDNRRSVRLYRDFVDPETEFDDAFRQGGWAGVSLTPGRHLRIFADARQSRATSAIDATTLTGSASLVNLTAFNLGVQGRASRYAGPFGDGRLVSASLEAHPWNGLQLEVGGGRRTDASLSADAAVRQLDWREVSASAPIGRSLFVMASAYQEQGDAGRSRQGYFALSWRF